MPNLNRITLLIAMSLFLLLAACTAPAPSAAPSGLPAQAAVTLPPAATLTPEPTATPVPSFTPTASPAPSATSTPAPTADLSLAQVKLIGLNWLPDYNFLLTFQFPGPVDPQNYRAMMEDKAFTCQVLAQYPNRLYCTGRSAAVESMAWVRLYQAGSDQPGFEQYTWIPYFTVEHK
jgi:hypothetical protein